MRNSVVLPAPFGPITPDDPARRQLEGEAVDQEALAEALLQFARLDHHVAEPGTRRDGDLRLAGLVATGLGDQLLIGADARLGLRLPRLGARPDPVELAGERALLGLFLLALDLEPLLLLLEPRRIAALVGNACAAIELERPFGDVVEEVAVVRDHDHGARIVAQMMLEPCDALGVEMVGRLVEQQDIRPGQKQLAKRHAPPFAARQRLDLRVAWGAAQRVHRLLDLRIEVPQILRVDLVLELRHLVGGLVGIVHGELVVAVELGLLLRHALHDVAGHVLASRRAPAPAADSRRSRPRPPRPRRQTPSRRRP